MKTTICDNMKSCSCFGEGTDGKEDSKMNMKDGMEKCMEAMNEGEGSFMKGAKWFMLIPGLILISAFLLTFFLNPEVVQILWLVITGTIIGSGLLFMMMATLWFRKIEEEIKA